MGVDKLEEGTGTVGVWVELEEGAASVGKWVGLGLEELEEGVAGVIVERSESEELGSS